MTGTETTKCFADRLQDLIAESGKDIKTLAAEIGISAGALSKYQNDKGEPGITALSKIAQYFGVTADYLVGRSNNRKPENTHIGKVTGLSDEAIERLEIINIDRSARIYSRFIASSLFHRLILFFDMHAVFLSEWVSLLENYKSLLYRLLENKAKDSERKAQVDRMNDMKERLELMEYRSQKLIVECMDLFEHEAAEKKKALDAEILELFERYMDSEYCPDSLKDFRGYYRDPFFYSDRYSYSIEDKEGAGPAAGRPAAGDS